MSEALGTTVLHSLEGGVLRLTLNRPEVANAIRADMREAIIAALEDATLNPEVRCVLLASNGKHFCSGADIDAVRGEFRAGEAMVRIMNGAQRLVTAIMDCGKPVIAAVQGSAAGLGAHMVFASDLVVAAEDAGFIEVFVRRGLTVDAGGAYLLPRTIGLQKAKEMIFFGDKLPATEALALGLVNKVVPAAELAEAAEAYAARLTRAPTLAISLAKRQLNKSLDTDRGNALLEEALCQEVNSRSHDATEGVRAFVEKRDPIFMGY